LAWVWLYRWEVVACCEVWLTSEQPVHFSCIRFAKMRLCQVSLLSRCSRRYLTTSAWGSCTLFMWTEGHVALRVVKVTWVDLEPPAFILYFLSQRWIVSRLVLLSYVTYNSKTIPDNTRKVYC
jgi:hypothetical protein